MSGADDGRVRLRAGRLGGCDLEVWTAAGEGPREDPAQVLAAGFEAEDAGPAETDGDSSGPHRLAWPLDPGTSVYGLGEVAGPLERTGRRVELWNTDAWCYDDASPALYQSHPWVLAVRADGSAEGLLAATPWRGAVAVGPEEVAFELEGPRPCVYRLDGTPRAVLGALAELCGRASMPPLWALGYHQCRWSYETEAEVRAVAQDFRDRAIPCDAVWLDIDYMDRFRMFTWSPERFPDPRGLTDELHAAGFRAVAIVDPGIAVAPGWGVYEELLASGHAVLSASGEPARGTVWPGPCHFPDFARASTRAWWTGRVAELVRASGLDGLWCDMNEPSVFDGPGKTLPADCVHRGLGGGGPHARFHDLYGQLMVGATRAGLEQSRPDARPFVLTRAGHLGTARLAATWTGDNRARWEDLAWSVPMVLSLGLSGQPFAGPDVGGFVGDPDSELFARWFALGAWLPFFRGHSEKTACRKEPWSFGPETEALVRRAVETRMRMLPTWYTLFRAASEDGLPVCRPLFLADPADPRLRAVDDAFLVGDDLLVAPVVRAGETERAVPLPRAPGGWYRLDLDGASGEPETDAEVVAAAPPGTAPVFARAGAIVAATAVASHTTAARWEPLELHVFPGPDGRATGRLFEDGGDGGGPWVDARLEARVDGAALEWSESRTGAGATGRGETRWVVHGGGSPRAVRRTGPRPERASLDLGG